MRPPPPSSPQAGPPRSVIVVGAGAAGLHAVRLLREAGAAVTVLEASDRCGGRVRALSGFAPWPIELGAEELHGERSLPYRLARAKGLPLRARGDRLRLFPDLAAGRRGPPRADDPDLSQARRFFDELPGYQGPDVTLAAALAPLPPRARAYLDAVLGNEYGASSERLGMHGLARAEAAWEGEGTRNFTVRGGPLLPLLQPEAQGGAMDNGGAAPLAIALGRVVRGIDWSASRVRVTTRGGERFDADHAVVTVPLPVLRDGDIAFTPALPAGKLAAARGIGCGPTLKIFLRFRRRLWPARRSSLTILGAPRAPELWTAGARGAGDGDDAVLTALVSGRPAEVLGALGERALPALLADLDVALGSANEARPATRHLAEHLIQDWGAEPFTRCGYSYPTPGSAPLRAELALPLRGDDGAARVVFAGEATHDQLFGSLQGALLSARQAVAELGLPPG